VRIIGRRFVRGWRHAEQDQVYDLACWCEGDVFLPGVRPSRQRVERAAYYRRIYALQAKVRQAAKDRCYAWRRRKRAEREAAKLLSREAHSAAVLVADGGVLIAYVQGEG
jgi:hypothetical protein